MGNASCFRFQMLLLHVAPLGAEGQISTTAPMHVSFLLQPSCNIYKPLWFRVYIVEGGNNKVLQIDANSRGVDSYARVSVSQNATLSHLAKFQRKTAAGPKEELRGTSDHCRMLLDRSKPVQDWLNGLALSTCCILLYVFCQRNGERRPTPRSIHTFFLVDGTLSTPIHFDPSVGSTSSSWIWQWLVSGVGSLQESWISHWVSSVVVVGISFLLMWWSWTIEIQSHVDCPPDSPQRTNTLGKIHPNISLFHFYRPPCRTLEHEHTQNT